MTVNANSEGFAVAFSWRGPGRGFSSAPVKKPLRPTGAPMPRIAPRPAAPRVTLWMKRRRLIDGCMLEPPGKLMWSRSLIEPLDYTRQQHRCAPPAPALGRDPAKENHADGEVHDRAC